METRWITLLLMMLALAVLLSSIGIDVAFSLSERQDSWRHTEPIGSGIATILVVASGVYAWREEIVGFFSRLRNRG